MIPETETLSITSQQQWRQWLEENHEVKQSIWVIFYKKNPDKPFVSWSNAVDEALCFGWIDSKRKTLDGERFIQFFSKRKSGGTWSKINKEKIIKLTEAGLMTKAGLEVIENAKKNGSWTFLDEVEELIIPSDLEQELGLWPGSKEYFESLSRSQRKLMLYWVHAARTTVTRTKRITEIASLAAQRQKPKIN